MLGFAFYRGHSDGNAESISETDMEKTICAITILTCELNLCKGVGEHLDVVTY